MSYKQHAETTLSTIRRLKDELAWAEESIERNANANVKDIEEKGNAMADMHRAIDGALDEFEMAGLAYVSGICDIEMLYDALGPRIEKFYSQQQVHNINFKRGVPETLAEKPMHKHSKALLAALHLSLIHI